MKRAALVLLAACSAPQPRGIAQRPPEPVLADAAPPAPALPTFASLAARGPEDLPAMREAARVERATDLRPAVDTCYRAIVGAAEGSVVRARFEDATGARGETGGAGLVPPRGPVCIRKGEALRFVVDGAGRAIVWQSP